MLQLASSCRSRHGQWRGHRWHDHARWAPPVSGHRCWPPPTLLSCPQLPHLPLDPHPSSTRRRHPPYAPSAASRRAAPTVPPRGPSLASSQHSAPYPSLSTSPCLPSRAAPPSYTDDAIAVVLSLPPGTPHRHLAVTATQLHLSRRPAGRAPAR